MKWREQVKEQFQKIPWLLIAALLCLGLSLLLLWRQVALNREANAVLSPLQATHLPSIRWFEQETTALPPISSDTLFAAEATTQASGTPTGTGATYILNTDSKKIHSPSCRYAQSMHAENKQTVTDTALEELLAQGYEICSVCGAE